MANEWPYVPISKLATVIIGGTPSRNVPEYWNGDVPWATAKEIAGVSCRYLEGVAECITQEGLENSAAKILPKGTIVITARGTVGSIAQLGRAMAFNQTCYALLPKDSLENDFLFYAMKGTKAEIQSLTYGTVFETITTQTFDHWLIPLPPLPEQRAIAHILGTLDDKIELNRRMNETLEAIARAIFKSWFIDFDPVRAKAEGRDPDLPKHIADLFPDSFERSELGKIPSGWRIRQIGEVATCVGGSTPSTKEPSYWEDGSIPFVTPKDMSQLVAPIIIGAERFITGLGAEKISSGVLPSGVVLLSSRAPIGYMAITTTPVSINQGIIALICNGLIPRSYAFGWIEANMERIKAYAGGTTFAEISKGNFRNMLAVIPPAEILLQYSSIFETCLGVIINNELECKTLISIRDTLLPKLMSGEIRIKDAERFVERIT